MPVDPIVTVIIPTYNRAGVICQAIDNVFQQTYKNIDLIVVDDGSTDDTLMKLREYGNRLRVITQANAGPAAARNRGIEIARGEIIAFQDSDDLWKPTKLQRQIALLCRVGGSVPCCLCNSSFGILEAKEQTSFDFVGLPRNDEEGLWLNVTEVLATRFVLFNQAVAIRREAIEKVGGFDEGLRYLEDYDLPLRLAAEGPWAYIGEPLVIYRTGAVNSFSQQAARDPVVLKRCEIAIFERALAKAEESESSSARRQLLARLRTFRRLLFAAELRQKQSLSGQIAGRVIQGLEHFRMAAFRRSPWYPKAETASVSIVHKVAESDLLLSSSTVAHS